MEPCRGSIVPRSDLVQGAEVATLEPLAVAGHEVLRVRDLSELVGERADSGPGAFAGQQRESLRPRAAGHRRAVAAVEVLQGSLVARQQQGGGEIHHQAALLLLQRPARRQPAIGKAAWRERGFQYV